jgi:hypothetical protein
MVIDASVHTSYDILGWPTLHLRLAPYRSARIFPVRLGEVQLSCTEQDQAHSGRCSILVRGLGTVYVDVSCHPIMNIHFLWYV